MSTIVNAIAAAIDKKDLSRAEMADVVGYIMDGYATPAQIGGLLVALRAKGETAEELVGAASAMRTRATPLVCPDRERSIDTCGTGGDGVGTVNISTLAAIILAACGGVVAKHGNRALSSRCGSADVLEALGIEVDVDSIAVTSCIATAGIGFAYAPRFHAATRHASGPRRELGMRTIFNLLGPLTNPAQVRHQVVGVYDRKWCEPVARALGMLGVRRAAVLHGEGGIDEIAVRGETTVALWDQEDDMVLGMTLTPAHFGVAETDPAGLAGGDASYNADVLREVLAARRTTTDPVVLAAGMTAALGLELLERDPFDVARLPAQLARAIAAIFDGKAAQVLERWKQALAT